MTDQPFETLYPDYDVLAKWDSPSWNEQTRAVVRRRLTEIPSRRFLTEAQWQTLEAVSDRALPQPERGPADKVPIVPWIDARLAANATTGTRFHPLPPMRECWQRALDAIDAEARERFARGFAELGPDEQDLILAAMNRNETLAPAWGARLPSSLFMRHVLLPEIVEIYYAHPAAWSEIGFGGPASPRGYLRLGVNRHDGWEGEEQPGEMLAAALRK
jgi:hypothetical protein